jgi:hypothetical protein
LKIKIEGAKIFYIKADVNENPIEPLGAGPVHALSM